MINEEMTVMGLKYNVRKNFHGYTYFKDSGWRMIAMYDEYGQPVPEDLWNSIMTASIIASQSAYQQKKNEKFT